LVAGARTKSITQLKDLGVKADIYASAEIAEYWVVNLKENKLIGLRNPVHGQYQARQELTAGHISPLAFPNLTIAVTRLLH
jgi:Uma2 family endonuclease